jgi:O-antigen biosynthesis protein
LLTATLITAIFGGYDNLKPLPDGHGFDKAFCFTDNRDLVSEGWEVIYVLSNEHPRLAAKRPKLVPFNFISTDVAVWLDGSFQIIDNGFKDFCLDSLGDKDFILWDHPENRNCLYQEAVYCQDWPKYRDYPIRKQTDFYRSEGMPENFGLYAAGTIVWANNDSAKRFGKAWLTENEEWSIQDQISYPYLLWKLQPAAGTFPLGEFTNPYLRYHQHVREF